MRSIQIAGEVSLGRINVCAISYLAISTIDRESRAIRPEMNAAVQGAFRVQAIFAHYDFDFRRPAAQLWADLRLLVISLHRHMEDALARLDGDVALTAFHPTHGSTSSIPKPSKPLVLRVARARS
ncbi:hypothetical protein HJC03_16490 [Rhizobium sp. NLR4b]|nr:hypothetical protein [Rhizobium sp. NLR4b]MBX5313275.1 hypothetical protein [Rhizobium sp. NLR11b]QTV00563.1 hypothetical protein J7U39_29165 [Rhizobium sp. NLR16a]